MLYRPTLPLTQFPVARVAILPGGHMVGSPSPSAWMLCPRLCPDRSSHSPSVDKPSLITASPLASHSGFQNSAFFPLEPLSPPEKISFTCLSIIYLLPRTKVHSHL